MKTQRGITLIEVSIFTSIIAIVAFVTTISYNKYIRTQKFSEVIQVVEKIESEVNKCINELGIVESCSGGAFDVPQDAEYKAAAPSAATKYLRKISTVDGKITATAITEEGMSGLKGEVYVVQASFSPDTGIVWTLDKEASTCDDEHLCR